MGLVIGKLGFGKDEFFYGLDLCLHKAGRTAYVIDERTAQACDVILITLFWWRDIYLLESFLRKAGIRKGGGGPVLIAGGMQATMCPAVIGKMVDVVFIGDADDELGSMLDQAERGEQPESAHLYRDGDAVVPAPKECAPSAFALHKGGKRDVVRIEIARGCKFACGFCALTGLKSYREVAFADIEPLLAISSPAPVSLFAPERTKHSEWPEISGYLESHNRRDLGQDVRLEQLQEIKTSSVTFGLEGISLRLRKSIGKGWKEEFVLDRLRNFVETRNGVAMVSVYFIADLPGEDEGDWAELRQLFEKIEAAEWSRRLTLKPVLNPFSPKPFTPLANAEIHPFRPYGERWRTILRKGGSGQWGFRCVETMVWGPFERILDVIATRGGADAYEVVRRLPPRLLSGKPPVADNERTARQILDLAASFGLTEELLGVAA
jgi:hypothetical protein